MVETALTQTGWSQWHGHNDLNAFEESVAGEFCGGQSSKKNTIVRVVVVFHLLDNAGDARTRLIVEQGGSALNRHLTIE